MITVTLLNEIDSPRIPALNEFQAWINAVCKTIPEKIPNHCKEICIAIIDPATSAKLNKTYRHKKNPTNVLSFNYEPVFDQSSTLLGDLAICADMAESEAVEQQKPVLAHWAHLTIHGMLHLLGFDHIVESDAHTMEMLEIKILNTLGFDNPYD